MTSEEKNAQMQQLRNEAKDHQATLGYMWLQVRHLESQMEKIQTMLELGQQKFEQLEKQQVESSAPAANVGVVKSVAPAQVSAAPESSTSPLTSPASSAVAG